MRPIHSLGVEHPQWLGGASVACIAQAEKQQDEVNMPHRMEAWKKIMKTSVGAAMCVVRKRGTSATKDAVAR
ncbi:UNVERIFIED_CONTAM: hypothetical protein Sradi_0904800 [Sesamum radiatum]|uniref:Uncharacterized protein n=1 Tax=Sesamum radiatum TaxID=300843 RepID=A0AAW2V1T7_SESRA